MSLPKPKPTEPPPELTPAAEPPVEEINDPAYAVPEPETTPLKPVKKSTSTTTIRSNGTETLGKPVPMLPDTPLGVLNNLIVRDDLHPQAPLEPADAGLATYRQLIQAIDAGEDLAPYKDTIIRLLSNQEEKREIFQSFEDAFYTKYRVRLLTALDSTSRHIVRAANRDDLTSSELLVFWRQASAELNSLNARKSDRAAVDAKETADKIDQARQDADKAAEQEWAGTTPQGRELIRKHLFRLHQQQQASKGIFPPQLALDEPLPEEKPEPEDTAPPVPITLAHPA